MSEEGLRPIIVKRIKKTAGGHHGGAWKIAYADFVTAMMAFFLLMWLLGSTAKGDMNGISEFFKTPLKVALAGGSGSGDSSSIITGGGKDLTRKDGQKQKGDADSPKRSMDMKAAKAALQKEEADRLKTLKARIEATIEANPLLKQVQEPAVARHHQRRFAHPDRRRTRTVRCSSWRKRSCSRTPRKSCT